MRFERFQHSTSLKIGRYKVSVYFRNRAGRFHWKRHKSKEANWFMFGWSDPKEHRWWATTIYVYMPV